MVAGPGIEPGSRAYETRELPFLYPAIIGWQGGDRTPDPLINSQLLLPAELLANKNGAPEKIRTPDILITSEALYQLSYKG